MFGRDQLRPAGQAYRKALSVPVDVPVLTIRGAQDRLVPARSMLPPDPYAPAHHRHVEIPGAGHLPHEESPAAVTSTLIDWLADRVS